MQSVAQLPSSLAEDAIRSRRAAQMVLVVAIRLNHVDLGARKRHVLPLAQIRVRARLRHDVLHAVGGAVPVEERQTDGVGGRELLVDQKVALAALPLVSANTTIFQSSSWRAAHPSVSSRRRHHVNVFDGKADVIVQHSTVRPDGVDAVVLLVTDNDRVGDRRVAIISGSLMAVPASLNL
eukprot:TRINITY_DN53015_c0_g1_i2.p1 TRINITY_DN53015_c0_g1~~TRINITY_DN53015_c0_g1_i2.p1  ORF type:complete len:180 (-),score=19.37 TRINITY_DN53015_c0_g1_i2:560-1099(-)